MEIVEFYFDENIFWQKPIFAGKNYFVSPVFNTEKRFFPPSGKNLPTLHAGININHLGQSYCMPVDQW